MMKLPKHTRPLAFAFLALATVPVSASTVTQDDPVPNEYPEPDFITNGGIPYTWTVRMADRDTAEMSSHVGAWSWDEDAFPETAKGWTHTSHWVALELEKDTSFTVRLQAKSDVPNPDPDAESPTFGGHLFPGFSLYRGWQDHGEDGHTFNNVGTIAWAPDVTYVAHASTTEAHTLERTWHLAAGKYSLALGGNSPSTLAEGRQGYLASFTTVPTAESATVRQEDPVPNTYPEPDFVTDGGLPYTWTVRMENATFASVSAHVGAWSWDEDAFPETAKGWTHTSHWVALELKENASFTVRLSSKDDVPNPDPDAESPTFGGHLFPGFSLYRGWQDHGEDGHTFNNVGNIAWAPDVTYIAHASTTEVHSLERTWHLAAGKYSLALGGNSPSALAEGRQGILAEFATAPLDLNLTIARMEGGHKMLRSHTHEGLRYQWQSSADLVKWSAMGDPFTGDGSLQTMHLPHAGKATYARLAILADHAMAHEDMTVEPGDGDGEADPESEGGNHQHQHGGGGE